MFRLTEQDDFRNFCISDETVKSISKVRKNKMPFSEMSERIK